MNSLITEILITANEILTAGIVIVAASMLLYNLTRNMKDRVARTSGVVLGCLTVVYVCDTFLTLGPDPRVYGNVLRLQWVGIAFIPVAMYHLSDALLATTGLPSRGRRRRVIRILYLISLSFLILATLTDTLIQPVTIRSPLEPQTLVVTLKSETLFIFYVIYFLIATGIALLNVQRARVRCIARSTRRRMGYLQIALLTPAIGIFPFSLLLGIGAELSLLGLLLVNLANIVVILMLIFLAYPLSFFGSRVPDRVVKVELLRFFLRGPGTGLLALGAIILTTSASRIFSLSGQAFTPFAVVAVVLLWQWGVAVILPALERWLVYPGEDAEQISKLDNLSDRLLTRGDILQLLEAILASACDYLRVSTAFAASLQNPEQVEIVHAQGPMRPEAQQLIEAVELIKQNKQFENAPLDNVNVLSWNGFWIVPLFSGRSSGNMLTGLLGIQARAITINLTVDELRMLKTITHRASQALDDLTLQMELFAALEGLLPQVAITRSRAATLEYRATGNANALPIVTENGFDEEQFKEQVRAALRHYWGGQGLASSRLLDTELVRAALSAHNGNAVKALRAVILEGLEKMRPEGERKTMAPEWTLYNIIEYRYIQQLKVREVTQRLAIGESDLYRKQRTAIDQLADILLGMERNLH